MLSHWFDVVRFAESDGFEMNWERSNAFRYRDYVIAAFNDDKPLDAFLIEQIAGDLFDAGSEFAVVVNGADGHAVQAAAAVSRGVRHCAAG